MKTKKIISAAAAFAVTLGMLGGYAPAEMPYCANIAITASAADTFSAPEYIYTNEWNIYWSKVEGAEYYNIYKYSTSKKKYVKIEKVSENRYSDTDLKSGKKYLFKISAVKKIGGKLVESKKSDKIIVNVTKLSEGKKVSVSKNCKFYDFRITDAKASSVSSAKAKKAVNAVKNSVYYTESMIYADTYASDSKTKKYLDSKGKVVPKAEKAYTYDFNGDGKKESFITVKLPLSDFEPIVGTVLLYCDSSGKMTVLDRFYDIDDYTYDGVYYGPKLIDYGDFKQFFIGGGTYGYNTHYTIYGERNGKVKCYADGRIGIGKNNCLMIINGHMGMGGTYYFDSAADEYRGIKGVSISTDKIKKMDKDGVLSDWYDYYTFSVLDGKYYLVNESMGMPAFIYRNGKFVRIDNIEDYDDCIRSYTGYVVNAENYVEDFDIDKAVKNMIKVK